MKNLILITAVFFIGLTATGQVLNQYSSIPNIEKLDVSQQGSSNVKDYVLYASSTMLYTSSYEITNNQFGPYNSIAASVNDITHGGSDFAVATNQDVLIFDMVNNVQSSTITGDKESVCMDGGYVMSVNSIGTDIYKANSPIWTGPTSFSVHETSPVPTNLPIQKVINEVNGEYYYMTKARLIYAENQRLIRGLNSAWNYTAADIHDNNTLLDFGMFVSPYDNDTMFYFVYDNNSGFVYNSYTDSVELYFGFGVTSVGYNVTDDNIYYTRPNSNAVYSVNANTSNLIDFSVVAYMIPGMNNSTEIEFDNDGNIWVSGDNGVFTSLSITGTITSIEDEDDTFTDASLYPNPNNGSFTINNIEYGTNVNVISTTGQMLYSSIVEQDNLKLDLDLPTGIYFVQLSNDNTQRTIKFVKH